MENSAYHFSFAYHFQMEKEIELNFSVVIPYFLLPSPLIVVIKSVITDLQSAGFSVISYIQYFKDVCRLLKVQQFNKSIV